MKMICFLMVAGCIAGCARPQAPHALRQPTFLNLLSAEQVSEVRQKLHLLQPGMTKDEAFAALGLSDYRGKLLASGGGADNFSWTSYLLRNGHGLLLVCDFTTNTNGIVIEASLDGERWPTNEVTPKH
jgi:hypothetical protein